MVRIETDYIKEHSKPDDKRFVFAYSIILENTGNIAARLLARHWKITDGNQKVQEIEGEGVVGQQPYLEPGQTYAYSSGCLIETPVGYMQGNYSMLADDGCNFKTNIPAFTLSVPGVIH